MIGINVGYFVCFRNLYAFFIIIFSSEGARITIMYGVICSSVITILVCVMQLTKLKKLNALFVKSKSLMHQLNQTLEMDGLSYTNELLQFAIKFIVIGVLNIYLSYSKLKADPSSMIFGYILPDIIISIMANIFHGVILITIVYLKLANQNIYKVIHAAVLLQESDKTNLENIEALCRFSDRINELTTYQYRLCDVTRELCGIFSFHITSWMIHKVCMILIQFFLIYVLIVLIVFRGDTFHSLTVAITFVQFFLTVAEVFFIAKACHDVNNEV